jgi:hypothetical protein
MNYGDLRTHFIALLNRSDITNALANTFLDQAISRIQRTLRTPDMERQQSYSISTQTASIVMPSDLLEIMDIYYDKTVLVRIPLHEMLNHKTSAASGTPEFFTRERSNIILYPEPASGSVIVDYYGTFAAMTEDLDENVLAAVASDLITYGALTYAADYFIDERSPLFESKYQSFLAEIKEQAQSAEATGTIQVVRPSAIYQDI